jgi:tetratricopeptide (TPR) repeat protein
MAEADPVEKLFKRTESLLEVHRYDDAEKEARRAIAAAPDDWYGHALLAQIQLRKGQPKEALASASQAAALAPDLEWPHRLRALALAELKRFRESVEAAETAVACEPELPEALYVLAMAQMEVKRLDEAGATAEQLRSIAPDSRLPYAALGLIAMERKRWTDAELHLRKALEIQPDSMEDLNNLGIVFQRSGRKKEAIELFHRAAALDPRSDLARKNLAGSIARYAGTGGLLAYAAIRIASAAGRENASVVVVVLVLVVFAVWIFVRRRRFQALDPRLRDFYKDEKRRQHLFGLRPSTSPDALGNLPNWVLNAAIVAFGFVAIAGLAAIGDSSGDTAAGIVVAIVCGGLGYWVARIRWRRYQR